MKEQRHNKKNGNGWRRTFREIAGESRLVAAERAWERAKLASSLRHHAKDEGRKNASLLLGRIKQAAITQALEVAPEKVRVTLDTDFHVGLVSVRWDGRGRLHLPAAVDLEPAFNRCIPVKRIA